MNKFLRFSLLSLLAILCTSVAQAGDNDLSWDYSEANIPSSPDKGLYYASTVNDGPTSNNGLHGVKLNSKGYAFFAKPAVAGTLSLSFGLRNGAGDYAIDVYACTIDGATATQGKLLGTLSTSEAPGTARLDVGADVTGIYIKRNTGSEGVLTKIVFRETVKRNFTNFEMVLHSLASEYDVSQLPEGVSFSGTYNSDQHGYRDATVTVPVDGTVKFTIGGCQYTNKTFEVKDKDGNVIATLDPKTTNCYHQDQSAITYFYVGEANTLTFSNIQHLPYFKAEATELWEAVITYKDQNGNKLGTKTVYEGDPIGDIPYKESDLTIPEGYKFRGWVYTSNIKVQPTDIVPGGVSVLALVTPIESVTVGSIQNYDLTQKNFYPEDHETISATGGKYYNNHGWNFEANGSVSVQVAGKAQIVLSLCQYGDGTTLTVTDANNNVIAENIPAKAETDGATTAVNYDGEATTLTFTFASQSYLHKMTVFNVKNFIEKDEASGYYIVPAGDGAGLVLAINNASSEPNSKIFLPNGTYDLGESVLTGISGTNVSIIGQSMENVVIKNAPPVKMEGLGKADLFLNTGTGLYMQDLTLQNALDYYRAGSAGRAPTLHDKGDKTINKNVRHLSYQDTYYSNKTGGLFYFEGGELHGTVDFLCGDGRVYFNNSKIVCEKRNSATISANSELYVFNNCTVENNADKYNLGRAWSNNPVCIYLNTTLQDPSKLESTRWNLSGLNCDYSIAGEYGTKDGSGNDITPASNEVTFKKQSTKMETILTSDQAATYTIDYVLGAWAATAQEQATQVDAPEATITGNAITWSAVEGASAYAIFKNDVLVGITTETSFNVPTTETGAKGNVITESDVYTIRSANARGGFGSAAIISESTGISEVNAAEVNVAKVELYNLEGVRVGNNFHGAAIRVETLDNGQTVAKKVIME